MGFNCAICNKIIAYLEVPYPITVVMMVIPFLVGFLLAGGELNLFVLTFSVVYMFSYIGGFNTLNAISDYELDAISKSHRPLPSNRLISSLLNPLIAKPTWTLFFKAAM